MKFNLALLGGVVALCSTLPAQAQYTQGWKPGQPVVRRNVQGTGKAGWQPGQPKYNPVATGVPEAPEVQYELPPDSPDSLTAALLSFDINNILLAGVKKLGLNVTIPSMDQSNWDERIPLITDDNFQDLFNEDFKSDEEAAARTWAIVISTSRSSKTDAVSTIVDTMFDTAFNTSQIQGDLPNVRWGRIDYFNVTYITTKWGVWQAPTLVIAKDKGRTLRFYRPRQIRINDEAFLEFLRTEGYNSSPPWSTLWAPGGDREWIMDIFATYMAKFYNFFMKIPKIFLYLISGGAGSLILSLMHRPSKAVKQAAALKEAQEKARALAAAEAAAAEKRAAESAPGAVASASAVPASPKKKSRALRKAKADSETVSESSPERTGTRSSARQRKSTKKAQ